MCRLESPGIINTLVSCSMEDDEGPSTSYKRSFPEGRDGPVFQDEPEEDSLFGGQSSEEFMAERQNQGL